MALNEYHESQAEKQNFLFPPKPLPPPPIEKSEGPVRDATNLLVKFYDPTVPKKTPPPNFKSSTVN